MGVGRAFVLSLVWVGELACHSRPAGEGALPPVPPNSGILCCGERHAAGPRCPVIADLSMAPSLKGDGNRNHSLRGKKEENKIFLSLHSQVTKSNNRISHFSVMLNSKHPLSS